MCLLIAGYRVHPRYPLIIAANREEAYSRATAPAGWWEDAPHVLGGRDLEAGGSWMGVSSSGRFAALTNYWESDPPHADPPSRGGLVRAFLTEDVSSERFLERLRSEGAAYNGFNLLFGDAKALYYYSNRSPWYGPLSPGIRVLSNHLLDTPWPKAERARRFFSRTALRARPQTRDLITMLDNVTAEEEQRDPETPLSRRQKLARQSIRIVFPRFGTRVSTAVIFSPEGEVSFAERSFAPEEYREFRFTPGGERG